MFDGTNLPPISDIDQDTYMFNWHEIQQLILDGPNNRPYIRPQPSHL